MPRRAQRTASVEVVTPDSWQWIRITLAPTILEWPVNAPVLRGETYFQTARGQTHVEFRDGWQGDARIEITNGWYGFPEDFQLRRTVPHNFEGWTDDQKAQLPAELLAYLTTFWSCAIYVIDPGIIGSNWPVLLYDPINQFGKWPDECLREWGTDRMLLLANDPRLLQSGEIIETMAKHVNQFSGKEEILPTFAYTEHVDDDIMIDAEEVNQANYTFFLMIIDHLIETGRF